MPEQVLVWVLVAAAIVAIVVRTVVQARYRRAYESGEKKVDPKKQAAFLLILGSLALAFGIFMTATGTDAEAGGRWPFSEKSLGYFSLAVGALNIGMGIRTLLKNRTSG